MNLYRYMSYEKFIDMLESKSLCFVYPPEFWKDSYEGFLFKAMQTQKGQETILKLLKSDMHRTFIKALLENNELKVIRYTCWTQSNDAMVLWSSYSESNQAIMIATTSGHLEKLSINGEHVHLMPITYVKSLRIEDEIGILQHLKLFLPNIFRIKRQIFDYENEVRAHIYCGKDVGEKELFRVPIPQLSDFIEGVLVHPRSDEVYVEKIKLICEAYNIRFLGQSKLFEFKC